MTDHTALIERLEKAEARIARLERNSHPPIDLGPAIDEILRKQAADRSRYLHPPPAPECCAEGPCPDCEPAWKAPAPVTLPRELGFQPYRRSQIAHLRPYIEGEALSDRVSISAADREAGSPKVGDMIARNPANHDDQWLIAADYFAANFEALTAAPSERLCDQVQADYPKILDRLAESERREPTREALAEAFRPITMQDVRLHVGEGELTSIGVLAGVNAELLGRQWSLLALFRGEG